MRTALAIAGSDSSGGAGIQADIKTMTMHGVYAMSAVTALTAQNTTGVFDIMEVTAGFLKKQLDCIFTDIYPDAVKIGMLSSAEIMETTADSLLEYEAKHVVLDPVMVSTSGSLLMKQNAAETMKRRLFPLAELITPNIPETEALTGVSIHTKEDMETAARLLQHQAGCSVLCKGGHGKEDASDLLCTGQEMVWLKGRRINNPDTHGTGCTLSSAIASNLALGYPLAEAVRRAKHYISDALEAGLHLGKGAGPLNHAFTITKE